MTKKIFLSIFSVCTVVFLTAMLLTFSALYGYFTSVVHDQLQSTVLMTAQGYEENGMEYLSQTPQNDYRITLMEPDGTVAYDSWQPAESLENHADRPEMKEALETGSGESARNSSTLTERFLYTAVRLKDGNVLRMAVSHYSVMALLMGVSGPLLQIFCGAVLIALLLAFWISRKIVQPLIHLDPEHPDNSQVCPELQPLMNRLCMYEKTVRRELYRLQSEKTSLQQAAAIQHSGTIVLDASYRVLYASPAALRILQLKDGLEGSAFQDIFPDIQMEQMQEKLKEQPYASWTMEYGSRKYLVEMTQAVDKKRVCGWSILLRELPQLQLFRVQKAESCLPEDDRKKDPDPSDQDAADIPAPMLCESL